jgi:predicted DNA-binding transcriptional regulator AlpA
MNDKTTLIKVSNYAQKTGIKRQMLYYFISQGKIDSQEIDGVKFIVLSERTKYFIENKK